MPLFYSAETCGFYDSSIHKSLPVDVVEITSRERADALAGERRGKVIVADASGRPVLVDSVATPEVMANKERGWRDSELERVLWLRDRHRDEQDQHRVTTLGAEQFTELLIYIQMLRDWPQSEHFPNLERRPAAASWIAEQSQ